MKPYAYSLRSNAHVSFPCYFNSWISIWVLFGTQINIHVLGALTHKISSVEVRDRGAKCRRGFYRVSTFDLNFATRNVAYLSDCPVTIAKQACSHVTLNMHSIFCFVFVFVFVFCFVLVVFVFVFYLFCLGHLISFVCFTSFENKRTWGFSMPVNKRDFNRENRTNLDYNRPSTRNQDNNYYAWYEIRKKRKEKKINWCRRSSRGMNSWKVKKEQETKNYYFLYLFAYTINNFDFEGKEGKKPTKLLLPLGSFFRLIVDIMKFH